MADDNIVDAFLPVAIDPTFENSVTDSHQGAKSFQVEVLKIRHTYPLSTAHNRSSEFPNGSKTFRRKGNANLHALTYLLACLSSTASMIETSLVLMIGMHCKMLKIR